MKITVLIENDVCSINTHNLKSEHGISLFIEANNKKILFDVGKSDMFFDNAKKMNIDLTEVDYLIISHGHFDHGGGLNKFLEINTKAKVYLHRKAVGRFYTKILGFIPFYIGLNQKMLQKYQDRFIFIDKDEAITDNMTLLENFKHDFPIPKGNSSLYEKRKNKFLKDKFEHEIVLLLKEKNKSVVITACSHSGVINMYNKAKKLVNNADVDAVFGGFHTYNPATRKNESKDYLDNLASEIKQSNTVFYTGHCTGEKNFKYLKKQLSAQLQTMHTGEIITIK